MIYRKAEGSSSIEFKICNTCRQGLPRQLINFINFIMSKGRRMRMSAEAFRRLFGKNRFSS